MNRALLAWLLLALCWHALGVGHTWHAALQEPQGNDYASYHYAVKASAKGLDAYDRRVLDAAARRDRTRQTVNPYLYPPPFLISALWTVPFSLRTGYQLWFWLDELALLTAGLVLWRWWRPLGPAVGPLVFSALALCSSAMNNHLMGQANLPVMALCLAGLWLDDRGRPLPGGALVGLACALKMSPTLFVLWWLLRGRFKSAASAVAFSVLCFVVSISVLGTEPHARFFFEVIPTFSDGTYNGLGLRVGLWGNHSVPNLWHQLMPPGPDVMGLSAAARIGASSTVGALLLMSMALLWRRPADALARWSQIAAVAVFMLFVPVFTFEHHLVWGLPAVCMCAIGLAHRRLHAAWIVPLVLAMAIWAVDLSQLRAIYRTVKHLPPLGWCVMEAKTVSLLTLYLASLMLGRTGQPAEAEQQAE